jgi:hypothetical protein
MNKWITIAIIIILAIGTIIIGILYVQENKKLHDTQSQVQTLHDRVSFLSSVFPKLGREFPLSIGQSILIADENLLITFKEVSKDNRCPKDAVCITQGEVVCLLEIKKDNIVNNIELLQSGLYYDYSEIISGDYTYKFIIEPYPEVDSKVYNYEYRLLLTVLK